MIDNNVFKEISKVFTGDVERGYEYKSGPRLVEFFNQYFEVNDSYGQGFPSRWFYVYNHLIDLYNSGEIDKFFNIILDNEYILREFKVNEVEAVQKKYNIVKEFNQMLKSYGFILIKQNDKYHLSKIEDDLELIGEGGFAKVYLQKSTGCIIKKLKEELVVNEGIRSRFVREYNLTKQLQDIDMIIKVIDFNQDSYSYRMERADITLKRYIQINQLDDNSKRAIIMQIMDVMNKVHSRNIVHRDLSPTNIFIVNGMIKIADFGLGKNLNVLSSYQTMVTNAVGQYDYCAPEQFRQLKDGDKRSDVYSLGKIINFIMTGSAQNSTHQFRSIVEKATSDSPSLRYTDATEMRISIEKSMKYYSDATRQKEILKKIENRDFDEDVEMFIYELSNDKMCQMLNERIYGFDIALLRFMKIDEKKALFVIQGVESSYIKVAGREFEAYDPFADFVNEILISQPVFSFTVNEIAAKILKHIAKEVNRFSAQRIIDSLVKDGVEPLIEEILLKK